MKLKLFFSLFQFAVKIDEGSNEKSSFLNLSETRLYIVIGLIAALVFLAILQAICTIYQTSSKSRNQKVTIAFIFFKPLFSSFSHASIPKIAHF